MEEAKIDANELLKEVDTSKEIPKEEKKDSESADGAVSTPRPRLFKPKQSRPAFQKILQQKLQDQQKAESQLVNGNGNSDQSEGEVAPPRKRFRPTSAPAASSRYNRF